MARYDTGTHDNHISLSLVTAMGFGFDSKHKGSFVLPNGIIVYSIGRLTATIGFRDAHVARCYFNVFTDLAVPVLFGLRSLEATETLTKHQKRLILLPEQARGTYRVCSIGASTNRVLCEVDGHSVFAHADTGSDITLISHKMVSTYNILTSPGCKKIMFADGSVGVTEGYIDAQLTLLGKAGSAKSTRFHVLRNCQFDIIMNQELVEEFAIFSGPRNSLVYGIEGSIPSPAPIIHMGTFETAFAKALDWARQVAQSSKKRKTSSANINEEGEPEETDVQVRKVALLTLINELDQEENRQRHWASQRFLYSPQATAEHERRTKYQSARAKLEEEYRLLGTV
ncbi:hypothetical protein BKA63DRAFT_89856 [Paraphoma chrysanthemicola]|nr:hypothetical protein BKA63DRAFT_89856 [Paraphoma chrysanthemicola]